MSGIPRRVPSYLGLLLDISRRNLDRVLYFAQYIVTHVDEEARRKAIARIDEQITGQQEAQNEAVNERLEEIKTQKKES